MRIDSRRTLVVITVFAAVVVLLGDALILLSGTTGSPLIAKLGEYFWADQEANVWSWLSSFLLGAIGLGFLLLAAARSTPQAQRTPHVVLGLAAILMSADETASLHEALGYLGDSTSGVTSHWLLLGVPLAAVAGFLALRFSRRIDPRLRRRLIVAGAVYLAGAVGLEFFGGMLSGPVGLPRYAPLYVLEVTAEEGLEFAGTLLALRAVLAAVLPLLDTAAAGRAPARSEDLHTKATATTP